MGLDTAWDAKVHEKPSVSLPFPGRHRTSGAVITIEPGVCWQSALWCPHRRRCVADRIGLWVLTSATPKHLMVVDRIATRFSKLFSRSSVSNGGNVFIFFDTMTFPFHIPLPLLPLMALFACSVLSRKMCFRAKSVRIINPDFCTLIAIVLIIHRPLAQMVDIIFCIKQNGMKLSDSTWSHDFWYSTKQNP